MWAYCVAEIPNFHSNAMIGRRSIVWGSLFDIILLFVCEVYKICILLFDLLYSRFTLPRCLNLNSDV